MNKKIIKGFTKVSDEEQLKISASGGIISSIISTITGGLSSLTKTADDASNIVIKNKIIEKMNDVQKGEVELTDKGGVRLKWDNTSSINTSIPNIIF